MSGVKCRWITEKKMNLLPSLTFIMEPENAGVKETKIIRFDMLTNSPRLFKGVFPECSSQIRKCFICKFLLRKWCYLNIKSQEVDIFSCFNSCLSKRSINDIVGLNLSPIKYILSS